MPISEGTPQSENIDISMKTKLIISHLPWTVGALRFDEKSFFNVLLCFTPCWDCKRKSGNIIQKNTDISKIYEIRLKCNCIDGTVVSGVRQLIFFSFFLKIFSRVQRVL